MKGKLIFIEGRIQTRAWDDKDGNKRYTTEIVASDMRMLEAKGGARGDDSASYEPPPAFPDGDTMPDDVPF